MRAVTIDSDLATLFTFTPRKPPITPIQGVVREGMCQPPRANRRSLCFAFKEILFSQFSLKRVPSCFKHSAA